MPRTWTLCYSTLLSESDVDQPSHDNVGLNKEALDGEFDDFLGGKPELQMQGVDPRKGWGFRGVHKVLGCVNSLLWLSLTSLGWNFDFVTAENLIYE